MEHFGDSKKSGEKFKRIEQLERAKAEVANITDKLGKEIDPGMVETIAIFRVLNLSTTSSCGGHANEKDGYTPPYIEFYSAAPEKWKEDERARSDWIETNGQQKERVGRLLNAFYATVRKTQNVKLEIHPIGKFNGFRLETDAINTKHPSLGAAIVDISVSQKEMTDFTQFLTNRFIDGILDY